MGCSGGAVQNGWSTRAFVGQTSESPAGFRFIRLAITVNVQPRSPKQNAAPSGNGSGVEVNRVWLAHYIAAVGSPGPLAALAGRKRCNVSLLHFGYAQRKTLRAFSSCKASNTAALPYRAVAPSALAPLGHSLFNITGDPNQ